MAKPLIDLEHLSVMTGKDPELAAEVLGLFREQVRMWQRLLDADQPAAVWADACHALKGTGLGIGATDLSHACSTAEKLGRSAEAPSRLQAVVALNDVKDAMAATDEVAARLAQAFELRGADTFTTSASLVSRAS